MAEKTSALESEAFKTKRMQEETAILKRKVRIFVIFSALYCLTLPDSALEISLFSRFISGSWKYGIKK